MKGSRTVILLLASVFLKGSRADDSACPCLNSSSSQYATVLEWMAANAYPLDYGLAGCRAYDNNSALTGCDSGNPAEHCAAKWCYVDSDLCPISRTRCEAQGFVVGSFESPYCRERDMSESKKMPSAVYSYETCGYLNAYDSTRISQLFAGNRIHIAIADSQPYAVKGHIVPSRPDLQGWTGVTVEWLYDIFLSFAPRIEVTTSSEWATAASRQVYPGSSYTACVLDVAVGNYDLCIGDFWITPERVLLTQFLPPYASDKMYLITTKDVVGRGLKDYIASPFRPFSAQLWAIILAFLVFNGVVNFLADSPDNTDDFDNPHWMARYMKCQYMSVMSYVSAGAGNSPQTIPSRIATLGFGFFILITLSSYTANLASLLVVDKSQNSIQGIHDCVERSLKVCVPQALQTELKSLYPTIRLVPVGIELIPAHIHAGDCRAGVSYELAIQQIQAGIYNTWNCENGHPDCQLDDAGDPLLTRDCDIVQVGGLITSIDLSMPVHRRWSHALGWATVQSTVQGNFEAMRKRFERLLPQPVCGTAGSEQEVKSDGSLQASSMFGTLFVAIAFQLFALLLVVFERWSGKTVQELTGLAGTEDDACGNTHAADHTDAENPKVKSHKANSVHPMSFRAVSCKRLVDKPQAGEDLSGMRSEVQEILALLKASRAAGHAEADTAADTIPVTSGSATAGP